MWIRLTDISPTGLQVAKELSLEQLGLQGEEWTAAEPVCIHYRVTKDREMIMIDGAVSALLRFDCSRCLTGTGYQISAPVHLVLTPAVEATEGVRQLQPGDLEQLSYREGGVELNDVTREQLLLSIPMRVLCRTDCRGLCPTCGRNLNEGACQCAPPIENAWAAPLKRLRS